MFLPIINQQSEGLLLKAPCGSYKKLLNRISQEVSQGGTNFLMTLTEECKYEVIKIRIISMTNRNNPLFQLICGTLYVKSAPLQLNYADLVGLTSLLSLLKTQGANQVLAINHSLKNYTVRPSFEFLGGSRTSGTRHKVW